MATTTIKPELNTRSTPIVKWEYVRLFCMNCTDGEMVSTGWQQTISPPNIKHRCLKCGDERWISGGVTYPRIEGTAKDGTKFTL